MNKGKIALDFCRNRFQLLLIAALLFLNYCVDENTVSRSYPRINTMPISNINEQGATFNAEIFSLGSEEILNHGFVWGTTSEPDLTNNRIYLGGSINLGSFSADIKSSLIEDVEYTVRPFIKTSQHTVYGKPASFKSLGSTGPVITGFAPDSLMWGETLTIYGKNFSWITSENKVSLSSYNCEVAFSTDTMIIVVLQPELMLDKLTLSVQVASKTAHFDKSLILKLPQMISFSPDKARWSDTISVRGRHFYLLNKFANCYLTIGNEIGNIDIKDLIFQSDTLCSFVVPNELAGIKNSIGLVINKRLIYNPEKFELLPPFFSFTPLNGLWDQLITLAGRFNTIPGRSKVFLGATEVPITSLTRDTIKIKVPNLHSSSKNIIKYQANPFTVVSSDTFKLKPPVITSIFPLSGPGGTKVTINGEFLNSSLLSVKFGSVEVPVEYAEGWKKVIVNVPEFITGPTQISVMVGDQTVIWSELFNITNPYITSVTPTIGTFLDEIVIEGKYFVPGSTVVVFRDLSIELKIKSVTENKIVIEVPTQFTDNPRSIIVICNNHAVESTEKFSLAKPEVISLSSSEFLPGQDLIIKGKNFNPVLAYNSLTWGNLPLNIKSASANELITTWPAELPRNSCGIKIDVNGMITFTDQITHLNSPWLLIPSPDHLSSNNSSFSSNWHIYGTADNTNGYLCPPINAAMYKYSPATGNWNQIMTNTPFSSLSGLQFLTVNNLIYVLGMSRGLNLYNTTTNRWEKISSYPDSKVEYCFGFSLSDKIYYGEYYSYNGADSIYTFKVCDPLNNYTWANRTLFPKSNIVTSFSLNNKGYLLFDNNQFWMYDPEKNIWTRKSDFGGMARRLPVSFVIGINAFVGTGSNLAKTELFSDIWRYNPESDVWTYVTDIPFARYAATSFTINNKAYIGYGSDLNFNQYEVFYEFDPIFLLR